MKKQSTYFRKKEALLNRANSLDSKGRITGREYVSNKGIAYDNPFQAKTASFFNFIWAGFTRGFPVVVPFWWYNAQVIYPLIIIKSSKITIPRLNHERIHVLQQAELLVVGAYLWYVGELIVRIFMYKGNLVKAYTKHSMEREAAENQNNADYTLTRPRYANFKYL